MMARGGDVYKHDRGTSSGNFFISVFRHFEDAGGRDDRHALRVRYMYSYSIRTTYGTGTDDIIIDRFGDVPSFIHGLAA